MGIEDSITTMEERDDFVIIHVELQDAIPDDVTLDIDDDGIQVIVLGAHEEFFAAVPLPFNTDVEHIQPVLEHGHLDLIIPKA